ncbi:DNA polymerase alpha/epsilon subunit B-domain-containing protein, partial [Spinellus fusiger]
SKASLAIFNREASNTIDGQFNGQLKIPTISSKKYKKTHVEVIQPDIKTYRYMFEKLKDKSDGLDEQIEFLGDRVGQQFELKEGCEDPSKPSQVDEFIAVGRVCCDATEGKLNASSVLLETSREISHGKRIPMDLGGIKDYSLFPGQIIAIQGINTTGKMIVAEKIIMPSFPPPLVRDEEALYKCNYEKNTKGEPIDIFIAAGPYTLDEDLSYQPLNEFIQSCTENKPDVLIMMGPFVSEKHPMIIRGESDVSPEQIFEEQVSQRIRELMKTSPHTHVILIPHAHDLIHDYPLFPQPKIDTSKLGLEKVQSMSNPATFEINGNRIVIGNVDILMSLSNSEISHQQRRTDRLERLSRHILEQQNLYPVFPPAAEDSMDAACLPNLFMAETPDFLILNSQLIHFVKLVDDVVCINPGHLSKKGASGTYAKLTIHPWPKKQEGGLKMDAKVWERTRVDLIRL